MSEKDLEASIIKLCKMYAADVDEFSQRRAGRCHSCGRRIYAGTQQTKGIPDLRVVWRDVVVWLEVKWEKNKPSPDQVEWMEREVAAGRFAAPVWSIDDVIYALAHAGMPLVSSEALDVSEKCRGWVDRWELPLGPASPADDLAGELGV
jgi:hypothetical protein